MAKPSQTRRFRPGDHACAIYSTDAELVSMVSEFLAEGLQRGERCWYVAAGDEAERVGAGLLTRGVDVNAETHRGALRLVTDAYLASGEFDAERTISVFGAAVEQALAEGFTGFRAAADMSWGLALPGGMNRMIAYEAMLKKLFSTSRVTGFCLYHRHQIPPHVVNSAFATPPNPALPGG